MSDSFRIIKVISWHGSLFYFNLRHKRAALQINKLDLFQNFPLLLSIVKEQKHFQKKGSFFCQLFRGKKWKSDSCLFFSLSFWIRLIQISGLGKSKKLKNLFVHITSNGFCNYMFLIKKLNLQIQFIKFCLTN